MSANTTYLVDVIKGEKETIEVSAVTEEEAKEEALQMHDVLFVEKVYYPDYEEEL